MQARNNIATMLRAALTLAVLLTPPLAARATPFEDALNAYHSGDYEQAIALWKTMPEDPRALFNLGQMHRRGEGITADVQEAIGYYEQAASLGHRSAQANLGTLYFFGEPPDPKRAIDWWRKAAIGGEPHAQHMIGVLYVNGEHVPTDLIKGYAWNYLAAEQQYSKGAEAIATLDEYLTPDEIAAAKSLSGELIAQSASLAIDTVVPGTPVSNTPQPSTAEAGGDYWLQFGALSTEAAVHKLWQQLRENHPELTRDLESRIVPLDRDGTRLFRLRGGSFGNRRQALQRCEHFQNAGATCLVTTNRN